MDIQCDHLFEVEFFSDFRGNTQEANLHEKLKFYKTANDACNATKSVEIKENKKTLIKFKSNYEEAKLYMEGLEMLDYNLIESNEGFENLYIKPSDRYLTLYDNEIYPLIPGKYMVRVLLENVQYFSTFKVLYKFLKQNEAEDIKLELEKELNGLAFELIRRNLNIGNFHKINELPIELFKFLAIKDKIPVIMAALIDLSDKPNYKISKYYKKKPVDKVKIIDDIGIRVHLKSKIKTGYMKAPIKYFNYNLPENRYLKKILEYIEYELKNFINIIDNTIESKKKLLKEKEKYKNDIEVVRIKNSTINYLIELKEVAFKIKNSINILKAKEWYFSLDNGCEYVLPHSMHQDPRYNILYKLYQKLKNESFDIQLDSDYSVQMKKTDKLYEMWCYIKLSKLLDEVLGFEIDGGWFFNQELYKKQIIVPELKANTRIKFKKDDIRMNFVYDSQIPRKKIGTNKKENPVFTVQNSNRPDARLDIYKKEVFIGSIIFEFKYRDRKHIWKFGETGDNYLTKQLRDYIGGCKTIHAYIKNLEVVQDVIVLCPVSTGEKEIKIEEDYHITFINLKPKKNQELVASEINRAINTLIQNYEDIKNGVMF